MILQGTDPFVGPSFSRRNRLARAAWSVAWTLLFRPSPRPLHAWRAMLLRAFGARVGRHVHVYPTVRIWAPWNLQLDDHTGVGDGAVLYSMATIHIERRAVVSQRAHLCTGTHDIDSPTFQLVARPIRIAAQAWICAEAFVGPGVHVHEGCVLAARGVLVKDTPEPWTVYAGNPAVRRRQRARSARRTD